MKSRSLIGNIILLSVFMGSLVFHGCSDVTNTTKEELTEEEVLVLEGVLGNALSEEDEGLLSGMMDMTGHFGTNGLNHRYRRSGAFEGSPFGDFTREYDPETGIHSISFTRDVDRPQWSVSLSALMEYQFTDPDGAFLEFPYADSTFIQTIQFNGTRTGQTERPNRSSSFERVANWTLSDIQSVDGVMTLEGSQTGTGSMMVSRPAGGEFSREYTTQLDLVDVTLQEATEDEDRLPYLVSGVIEYQTTITKTVNGEETVNEYSGTIELSENGEALVRFFGLKRTLRLNLANGSRVDSGS
jgi:hypothetical protein